MATEEKFKKHRFDQVTPAIQSSIDDLRDFVTSCTETTCIMVISFSIFIFKSHFGQIC
jgi:L-cysteine desulfidase